MDVEEFDDEGSAVEIGFVVLVVAVDVVVAGGAVAIVAGFVAGDDNLVVAELFEGLFLVSSAVFFITCK